jgi:putative transposase
MELWLHIPRRPSNVFRQTAARDGTPRSRRSAAGQGVVRLPKRWVAERAFAWLGRPRRLFKDCERLPESSEAMIQVSMIHMMLRRLAPAKRIHSQRFRYAA